MKTRAAVLWSTNQPFQIEDLDLAPPGDDEVLVRMQAAGVCHSDWHVVTGDSKLPLPAVLGHEGAGVVEEVGRLVTHVRPGDQVILNWAPHCGTCYWCTHDRKCLCPTFTAKRWGGTQMDGTTRLSRRGQAVYQFCAVGCFADFVVAHKSSCVPVGGGDQKQDGQRMKGGLQLQGEPALTPALSRGERGLERSSPRMVDPRVAALVGCAVTTGVGAVVCTAQVPRGASVVVLGVGGVGLSAVMGAAVAGAAPIIAIDRSPSRCSAASRLGATAVIAADGGIDLPAKVRDLTEGRGADFVFEAVGLPAVQEQALALVRAGGAVVLAGLSAMGSSTNLPGAIITRREISVLGSYYGTSDPMRDFRTYLDWWQAGLLPLSEMVGKEYRLDAINDAYADLARADGGRGVIVW